MDQKEHDVIHPTLTRFLVALQQQTPAFEETKQQEDEQEYTIGAITKRGTFIGKME